MMTEIVSFFTFRTIILLFSTTFSIILVMLMLNIITVDDLVSILKLSPDSANAFKLVLERFREVVGNILDILSQVLKKLFSWAGLDIDLSKIKSGIGNPNQSINNPTKQ